jgi:catalase
MYVSQQILQCSTAARSINGASAQSKQRHIDHCTQADPEYGAGVAQTIERLE